MKCSEENMMLYAITDRHWLDGRRLEECVEDAIKGGVTMIQYREKNLEGDEYLEEAKAVQRVCGLYEIPFIINDNVEAARVLNADGVHLGQGDMNPEDARRILGSDKIIGITAKTVEQAKKAEHEGANYLGSGAIFHTDSKDDAVGISHRQFNDICAAVNIPVVAIGGINRENIDELNDLNMSGIAVIGSIFGQADIRKAAAEMKDGVTRIVKAK